MEKVIAQCGITCSDCPTFNATKMDDDAERTRVADLWTKQYGHAFKSEDINCDGCLTGGTRVFNYCNVCEIRKCRQEKNLKNCATVTITGAKSFQNSTNKRLRQKRPSKRYEEA